MSGLCCAVWRKLADEMEAGMGLSLVVNEEQCWGCRACEVACKLENNIIQGQGPLQVYEMGPRLDGTRLTTSFGLKVCRHCEEPECLAACPSGAIERLPHGLVVLDQEKCNGCQACIEICPFGAISLDEEKGVAIKCNMCHHRLKAGLYPPCAEGICMGDCIRIIET